MKTIDGQQLLFALPASAAKNNGKADWMARGIFPHLPSLLYLSSVKTLKETLADALFFVALTKNLKIAKCCTIQVCALLHTNVL